MEAVVRTTRFSGADWATELQPIILVGAGGIGSWTALNLSRIGHELFIIDPDIVDETNVIGGQLYRKSDIGKPKAIAVTELCRELGCISSITPVQDFYTDEVGVTRVMITGLDNMAARKVCYEAWKAQLQQNGPEHCLFIDGRLTLEMYEILTLRGDDLEGQKKYEEEYLFSDEEADELDCTTKQSTFGAMGIACQITATLCNWLTNRKLEMDFREVPFYQRMVLPMMDLRHSNQVVPQVPVQEGRVTVEIPEELQKLQLFKQLFKELLIN